VPIRVVSAPGNWHHYKSAQGGKPSNGAGVGGAATIQPGQTVGGKGGGVWSTGVDTNSAQIFWFAVLQSDIDAGKTCPHTW
jgi:hypothetical protein